MAGNGEPYSLLDEPSPEPCSSSDEPSTEPCSPVDEPHQTKNEIKPPVLPDNEEPIPAFQPRCSERVRRTPTWLKDYDLF